MTFYFYDLETTGISGRTDRVMQFAGQRTTMDLKLVGEPDNIFIRLSDDILPSPEAIFVTGITPQQTMADGMTEAEFLKYFMKTIAAPDTIFLGYNTIRFDDEFMRFMLYRNYYDAYEWQWAEGRSRWDLLDLVRMTRALRPDGITWPFAPDGKPSNRLELLTAVNNLQHENAHDALSDVHASIAVARLIRNKQTKLFEYLLSMRDKKKVAALVQAGKPFVYCSGSLPSEYEKATVAVMIADEPKHNGNQGALVYDLRRDPTELRDLSPAEMVTAWRARKENPPAVPFPVKMVAYNKAPAVAPLSVLDDASKERLKLDIDVIKSNLKKLQGEKEFIKNVLEAVQLMDRERQASFLANPNTVDEQLYDGFFPEIDKTNMSALRAASPDEIGQFADSFKDDRLNKLLLLYKARNYPRYLNSEERAEWELYRFNKLFAGGEKSALAQYFKRLETLAAREDLTSQQMYLLEELQLYAQSIVPSEA